MKNKILILGATSFGGSSFLKFLNKKKNLKFMEPIDPNLI